MDTQEAPVVPTGNSIFHLGSIEVTEDAKALVTEQEIAIAVGKHAQGDWGGTDNYIKRANRDALETDWMIESSFRTQSGAQIRVVTRPSAYITQISLPEED